MICLYRPPVVFTYSLYFFPNIYYICDWPWHCQCDSHWVERDRLITLVWVSFRRSFHLFFLFSPYYLKKLLFETDNAHCQCVPHWAKRDRLLTFVWLYDPAQINTSWTPIALMHVYVRPANFTPKPRFRSVNLWQTQQCILKEAKSKRTPTHKQRGLVKGLQGISYKRGLVVNLELVMSSCRRPITSGFITWRDLMLDYWLLTSPFCGS